MGGSDRSRGFQAAIACSLVVTIALGGIGCGDDEDSGPSAGELAERLAPAEQLGLEVEREFEWDNATDFVVQGMYHSETTVPSELIGAIDDAGFTAAAGTNLTEKDGSAFAFLGAAAFDSEDDAATALETVHSEDLKQPCFAVCAVTPTEYTVSGIPNSAAVHHAPSEEELPHGLSPFEAYHVEFTIGSDLYLFQVSGEPGLSAADFKRDAKAIYEHAAAKA